MADPNLDTRCHRDRRDELDRQNMQSSRIIYEFTGRPVSVKSDAFSSTIKINLQRASPDLSQEDPQVGSILGRETPNKLLIDIGDERNTPLPLMPLSI
ncbi:hypothetical protein Egran_05645 [Elaphomyces granulatus]|uniref:Uncharacterized protein n=1 Tax=Elaphomyces granulatus TaxID=519963 RepID=A0A232LR26_9EURO|nr:hypothetical protein Egran_05645 [Elaphomyces granulatus]